MLGGRCDGKGTIWFQQGRYDPTDDVSRQYYTHEPCNGCVKCNGCLFCEQTGSVGTEDRACEVCLGRGFIPRPV